MNTIINNQVPDEVLDRLQLVVVTEESIHFIAPEPYRTVIWDREFELPDLHCPIIDVTDIDVEQVGDVIQKYTDRRRGVVNMEALRFEMEGLGARVDIGRDYTCALCEFTTDSGIEYKVHLVSETHIDKLNWILK